MRIVPVALLLGAALAFTPAPSSAQSLAEAAAKERERRKAAQGKGKVYTEENVNQVKGGTFSAPSGPGGSAAAAAPAEGAAKEAAAGAPAGKKEKTPEELKAEQEKAWRDKVQKANEEIANLTTRIDALQNAVNDLSQNLYGSMRSSQLAELEQARQKLAATKQSLSDLEEEGRRSGYR